MTGEQRAARIALIATLLIAVAPAATSMPAPSPGSHVITVNIVSPNGGETLNASEWWLISWSYSGGPAPYNFDLEYSTQGSGGPWQMIKQGTGQTTSYQWTIPPVSTTNGYIRISGRDSGGGTDTDTNDASFRIYMPPAPAFHVQAPNGGESLTAGDNFDIKWGTLNSNRFNRVNVSWSGNGSSGPWTLLTNTIPNTGVYSWKVPNFLTTQGFVKVHAHDMFGRFAEDVSNASFSIKAAPFSTRLTSPLPGSAFNPGQPATIDWTKSGGVGPFKADLDFSSTGSGGPWSSVATGLTGNSYAWTVPSTLTADAFVRVKVTDSGTSQTVEDANDAAFSIVRPKPVALVQAPNGGQKLDVNSTFTVQWTGSGGSGPLTYTASYSTSGAGGPWTEIVRDSQSTSAQWKVPDKPTSTGYIKVEASDGFEKGEDVSDTAFEIRVPPPAVTAQLLRPVGGEQFYVLSTENVGWKAGSSDGSAVKIDLEYSTSGPAGQWEVIAQDLSNTGKFMWQIPSVTGDMPDSWIRVTAKKSTGEQAQDTSDAAFTIARPKDRARLDGTVTDFDTKAGIEGVTVRLVGTGHTATTAADGWYLIDGIQPGQYTVEMTKPNYDVFQKEITLDPGSSSTLDAELVSQFSPSKGKNVNIVSTIVSLIPYILILIIAGVVAAVAVALVKRARRGRSGNCSNCRIPVPYGQQLCARCGAKAGLKACPKCRTMNTAGGSWCAKCGTDISMLVPPPVEKAQEAPRPVVRPAPIPAPPPAPPTPATAAPPTEEKPESATPPKTSP